MRGITSTSRSSTSTDRRLEIRQTWPAPPTLLLQSLDGEVVLDVTLASHAADPQNFFDEVSAPIRLRSTNTAGCASRKFITGMKLCPPRSMCQAPWSGPAADLPQVCSPQGSAACASRNANRSRRSIPLRWGHGRPSPMITSLMTAA